ncbi:hypothetical protein LguiA_003943 [Lonicera macranthoides]
MDPKKNKAPPPSSKPAKSRGGKQKTKKWSKGKQKEKVNDLKRKFSECCWTVKNHEHERGLINKDNEAIKEPNSGNQIYVNL